MTPGGYKTRRGYLIITVTHRLLTLTHKMRTFIAVLALVAIAAADVSHLVRSPEADAVVVEQEADVFPDQYQYKFRTSNDISAQESGVLKNVGREDEGISVQGSNSYTGPDGAKYSLTYTADENGYQPQGAHLPTPPPAEPIPEYIKRAVDYILSHPPKPEPGSKY